MKHSILLFILFIGYSCTNEIHEESQEDTIEANGFDYYLNFSIVDSIYFEHQDSFFIESIQDMDHEIVFIDAYLSKHTYPYFYIDNSPLDLKPLSQENISMAIHSDLPIFILKSHLLVLEP